MSEMMDVLITKVSLFTGKTRTWRMRLRLSDLSDWRKGKYIQDALPYLTADEREFLLTGATPEEWETLDWKDNEEEVFE